LKSRSCCLSIHQIFCRSCCLSTIFLPIVLFVDHIFCLISKTMTANDGLKQWRERVCRGSGLKLDSTLYKMTVFFFYFFLSFFMLSISFLFIRFISCPVQLILFIWCSRICFAQYPQNSFFQSKSFNSHASYRAKHLRLCTENYFCLKISICLSLQLRELSSFNIDIHFGKGEMAIVLINNFLTLICKKLSSASLSRNHTSRRVGKLSSTKVHFLRI